MQFSLAHFGAVAAGRPVELESAGGSMPGSADELKPIIIDLSEPAEQGRVQGMLHGAAEFLIVSITGCAPKR